MELVNFLKYSLKRVPHTTIYKRILSGKSGIEIGGTSKIFHTILPISQVIARLNGVNFSNETIWEGSIHSGNTFNFYEDRTGYQFINEATDLKDIPTSGYDFLLSSNCLEHVANPLAAVSEWKRIITNDGYLLLVLPRKESNFDRKRPITTFNHLLDDYNSNVTEHDLTHMDEILDLHDFSMDPLAGTLENLKLRC